MGLGRCQNRWVFAIFVTTLGGCSHELDTSRVAPARGTLGEEVFSVLCSRVGAQALTEDLTGASYKSVCERGQDGTWATSVDVSKLPPLRDGAPTKAGDLVPLASQEAARKHSVARIEALARRRQDLVDAIDAVFPDVEIAALQLDAKDPKATCQTAAGQKARLTTELSNLMGRLTDLYNDGTLPESTQSLGRLMTAFRESKDSQAALARFDARQGYRPIDIALGVAKPLAQYPRLRELSNTALRLLSPDSDPLAENAPKGPDGKRIPQPGPAYESLTKLMEAVRGELATAQEEASPTSLTQTTTLGRPWLSRPRTSLEMTREILLAKDDAFGAGATERFIALRDSRGFARVRTTGGKLPAPFLDEDADGLADVDEVGRFKTVGGAAAPTPFFVLDGPTAEWDQFGRARLPGSTDTVYEYLDTSKTFIASLVRDVKPLLNPDPAAGRETLMYAMAGAPIVLGPRAENATRCYATGASGVACDSLPDAKKLVVRYRGFDTAKSPALDLAYAAGQLFADKSTDATLAFAAKLFAEAQPDLARTTAAALAAKEIANKDKNAALKPDSVLWDDLLDVLGKIAQVPGLLEAMMTALAQDESKALGGIFAQHMTYRDRITYDRNNLNGPVYNATIGAVGEAKTPVDRSQPDSGDNRSAFQRFIAIVNDTTGVAACNKAGAKVHARGVPILGNPTLPLGGGTYKECEVYYLPNLAEFYVQSIIGKAQLKLRDGTLKDGILGIGAATVKLMEDSSQIKGFWDEGGSRTLRPKPQFLNRLVHFDLVGDTENDITKTFIADLSGNLEGTTVCSSRTIDDPSPNAEDAIKEGPLKGKLPNLRTCKAGEYLRDRHADALFLLEQYNFYSAVTPLVSAFSNANRVDLFLDLMRVLHKHYASDKGSAAECRTGVSETCSRSNAVSYEPLLAEIMNGDTLLAVNALLKRAQNMTVKTCTALDPKTNACTTATDTSGITVLAEAARAMLDPARAAAAGITSRSGAKTAKRNDGTDGGPITPAHLLVDALKSIDAAFEAYQPLSAGDGGRKEAWRTARSQLVDEFLSVDGAPTAAAFRNKAVAKIAPVALDVIRAQLVAHCPTSFAPPYAACTWAKKELVQKAEEVLAGPVAANAVDLLDIIRQNDRARFEAQTLAQYLLEQAAAGDNLSVVLASLSDLLQLLADDKNLVPFQHVLADALAPTEPDATGKRPGGLVDAQLTLLSRLTSEATTADGARVCSRELDPYGIIQGALERLVTPMKADGTTRKPTPLEVIVDVIADVNRVDPSKVDKLVADDYGNIAFEVSDFLLNEERGLEQFYEVVRRGTQKR